ncbi:MAG: hypothetical protein RBT11_19105 [Desulfobacterales bacterium]|jgi:hypothetical protein|nr:hypothetical protein [Desulfobacterales bacterium]MDY0242575.1 hypothetical protein [Rhodospirillaceae bacterium]
MIDIQVKMTGMTDLLKSVIDLPGVFSRCRASALKSLGWNVQQDLKKTGRALQPRLNPHTGVLSATHPTAKRSGRSVKWSKVRRNKKWVSGTSRLHGADGRVAQKLSTRKEPFSRFVNMVRYSVDPEDTMVEIGLLKPKPIYYVWMKKNVAGFGTKITPKMRRFLFASGFPVRKETDTLKTPARPWVDVVRKRWEQKATNHFEKKFWEAYDKYATGGRFNPRGA